MIRDLFLDLDDTLLDFGEAERHGILRTLRELGIAPTEETLALYSRINQQQWERFERGEIPREQVLIERFSLLFQALGCAHDPEDAENRYRRYLGIGHWFVPGAEALLCRLAPRYRLYLASNGGADTQYSRLESAGISHYFQEIFISSPRTILLQRLISPQRFSFSRQRRSPGLPSAHISLATAASLVMSRALNTLSDSTPRPTS